MDKYSHVSLKGVQPHAIAASCPARGYDIFMVYSCLIRRKTLGALLWRAMSSYACSLSVTQADRHTDGQINISCIVYAYHA